MHMRGCGSGQCSTLTRAHTYLNLWVLPGPVPRPIKAGFYPTYYRYFLQIPIRYGSNCHPYYQEDMFFLLWKTIFQDPF